MQDYVSPLIKDIMNTATKYHVKLVKAQENSNRIESEIDQTKQIDEEYIYQDLGDP